MAPTLRNDDVDSVCILDDDAVATANTEVMSDANLTVATIALPQVSVSSARQPCRFVRGLVAYLSSIRLVRIFTVF